MSGRRGGGSTARTGTGCGPQASFASGPLAVDFCLRLGYTAITIGTLGFLGLGLPPPTPDWGTMVNEGRAMAIAFPHLVIFPCLAISSLMLGLSLLADGLREVSEAQGRRA